MKQKNRISLKEYLIENSFNQEKVLEDLEDLLNEGKPLNYENIISIKLQQAQSDLNTLLVLAFKSSLTSKTYSRTYGLSKSTQDLIFMSLGFNLLKYKPNSIVTIDKDIATIISQ